MLKPTLDVEVAEPEIFKPERVVVPKPRLETVSFPFTSKSPAGLTTPTPTLPNLSTINDVAVVEPITNATEFAVEFTESCPSGVELPIPKLPVDVNVDVAVPPKYAVYAD